MGFWGAIKKAINTDLSFPLDKLITEHGIQTFTEDGTFIVPKGVKKVWITACGGGQGGGSGTVSTSNWKYAPAGGDGGECIIRESFSVLPNQQIDIVIGTGGVASKAVHGAEGVFGDPGGNTVIGSLVTIRGGDHSGHGLIGSGKGGTGYTAYSGTERTSASAGEDGIRGVGGRSSDESSAADRKGGGGGSYGNGGDALSDTLPGYGGGGAGGQDGGSGVVFIEW